MMHRHPTVLLAVKFVLVASGTIALFLRPLLVRTSSTGLWVRRTPAPTTAAAAAAAAAAPSQSQHEHESTKDSRERVLQACVRDGGFYEGEWVHRPHALRPHAHYARGLKGKHVFFDGMCLHA